MNHQELINKIACLLMKDGKKSVAHKILNKSLTIASNQLNITKDILLKKSLENIKPTIDARSKRVGRISYIIPYGLTDEQSTCLALKILIGSARSRKEKQFVFKLANELVDSFHNKGASIKKKNEIHMLAEANKSFAFFR